MNLNRIIPYRNQKETLEKLMMTNLPQTVLNIIKKLSLFLFQKNPYDVFSYSFQNDNNKILFISNKTKKEDIELIGYDSNDFSFRLYEHGIFCFMAGDYDSFIEYLRLV